MYSTQIMSDGQEKQIQLDSQLQNNFTGSYKKECSFFPNSNRHKSDQLLTNEIKGMEGLGFSN